MCVFTSVRLCVKRCYALTENVWCDHKILSKYTMCDFHMNSSCLRLKQKVSETI